MKIYGYDNKITWIIFLRLTTPYSFYELSVSGGCLFLSVASATAVHEITEIFMTPASESRQTDDKHTCDCFHSSDLKFITRVYAYASPCICLCRSSGDIDYFRQTSCLVGTLHSTCLCLQLRY